MGSLRDQVRWPPLFAKAEGSYWLQVIYPHKRAEMHSRGITDHHLMCLLKIVKLDNIVLREGGWDVKKDWANALSGGALFVSQSDQTLTLLRRSATLGHGPIVLS